MKGGVTKGEIQQALIRSLSPKGVKPKTRREARCCGCVVVFILETAVKANRRGAESFLVKHPTVGIAGRLVFGF